MFKYGGKLKENHLSAVMAVMWTSSSHNATYKEIVTKAISIDMHEICKTG